MVKKTKKQESNRRLNTFADWVLVRMEGGSEITLVNPVNIENIWPSEDGTIVSLVSGKKLVDERPIDQFTEAEGSRLFESLTKAFTDSFAELKSLTKSKFKSKKVKCEKARKDELDIVYDEINEQVKVFSPAQAGQALVLRRGTRVYKHLETDITYPDLVSVLGVPTFVEKDDSMYPLPKIQWVGTIDGEPFVVNDGQESYPMYSRKESVKGYRWYVQAGTGNVVDRVTKYICLEMLKQHCPTVRSLAEAKGR